MDIHRCLVTFTIFCVFWDISGGLSREEGDVHDNHGFEEPPDFDFDGLPGVEHEFKVDIPPGREQCFFQMIKHGAQLHFTFEVLKGSDRNVDMVIKRPDGSFLDKHLWTSQGTTDQNVDWEGIYAFCFDNTFSRFSAKLVYFYVVTFFPDEWEAFQKDLEEVDASLGNFTVQLAKVDKAMQDVKLIQAVSRQSASKDWYTIKANNSYIQNWSMLMIGIVMCTGGLQVYFVRRLFHVQNVTPTSKPRA